MSKQRINEKRNEIVCCCWFCQNKSEFIVLSGEQLCFVHGLQMPREEIAITAPSKIQSKSQIFRYGRSIFCLPHRPNFSDIFDLCLHWVSVVRAVTCFNAPNFTVYCPNVSTTPIMSMGCQQCLPLSVVQLKGKHCRKTHCHMGL